MAQPSSDATWYVNSAAGEWTTAPLAGVMAFHRTLPGYEPTQLVELPGLAAELGVARLFVKDESSRLGLPAFKILGAAYAVSRALSGRFGIIDRALPLEELRRLICMQGSVELIAATDGNHGRAVARVARLIGARAHIFYPSSLTAEAKRAIASEQAETTELTADYDGVVSAAAEATSAAGEDALLIQDMSWPGYEQVPEWIVDGYSTLFEEAGNQLAERGIDAPDLIALPVGVGSLLHAAVRHYRSRMATLRPAVLSVEPVNAPAIMRSLQAGRRLTVQTHPTIMAGLNCGTPSEIAWPYIEAGLDAAVIVTEEQAAAAVH
ncbi:MAG TPA: pyridoxal-phosphate dependent enzyme, partial [Thermomicrobiaceae bacterium]|nr:pyridoxal-phosphate dependent enzyme [Thermomicrobiaceae bacterium]